MRATWEFHSTGRIVFGPGALSELPRIVRGLGARRALVIADPGIAQAGILTRALERLADAGCEAIVFDQAVPEPPVDAVMACCAFARSQAEPDAVIGLGGGSSIDMAKLVALLLTHGGHPRDYYGERLVPGPTLPLIAVPTTAGTGSEVTPVAVVNDTASGVKVGVSSAYLRPDVALLDPELTIGLPPYVTACSGIDALAHAVEAYLATDYKYIQAEGDILFVGSAPVSDALALRAVELIARHLALAVHQGGNLEARSQMLLGSLMAGMAFSNAGTAAAHALAYPIGGLVKSPHGETTGLLLPYVLQYNAPVCGGKLRQLAAAFGLAQDGGEEALRERLVEAVFRLLRDIGLPTRLTAIGIRREDVPDIALKALAIDRLIRNNPRRPTANSLAELLYAAL